MPQHASRTPTTRRAGALAAIVLLAGAALPLAACAEKPAAPERALPAWLEARIEKFQREPVANPPRTVWRYRYRDATVFYFPPHCCDIPGELADAEGTRLCAPDGGITGRGDGKCADFFATRTEPQRVWADPRPAGGKR